jgi:predicted nucleic acid-binding protein
MKLYFDTAYIAKCYLNDPDAPQVRRLLSKADAVYSSALCVAEMACAFHRRIRERSLSAQEGSQLRRLFLEHVSSGVWTLLPVTDAVLRSVDALLEALPAGVPLRVVYEAALAEHAKNLTPEICERNTLGTRRELSQPAR